MATNWLQRQACAPETRQRRECAEKAIECFKLLLTDWY